MNFFTNLLNFLKKAENGIVALSAAVLAGQQAFPAIGNLVPDNGVSIALAAALIWSFYKNSQPKA